MSMLHDIAKAVSILFHIANIKRFSSPHPSVLRKNLRIVPRLTRHRNFCRLTDDTSIAQNILFTLSIRRDMRYPIRLAPQLKRRMSRAAP
jgi:hypothetical protein